MIYVNGLKSMAGWTDQELKGIKILQAGNRMIFEMNPKAKVAGR